MSDFLNEVCTFAVANRILKTSPAYLNKMVGSGKLIEGVHYARSGRNCLITKEAVKRIAKIKGIEIEIEE